MADYNLSRLQGLFSQAFTAEELKILCYDRPEYKAVYNQITAGSDVQEISRRLIVAAGERNQLEALLDQAEKLKPGLLEALQAFEVSAGDTQPVDLIEGELPMTDKEHQTDPSESEEAQSGPTAGHQATLSGSGVVIQGSTVQAGDRSVVGANAGGDLVVGDHNTVVRGSGNVLQTLSPAEAAQLFAPVYEAIEAKTGLPELDKADLKADVGGLEEDAANPAPESVDESFLARRLRNIERMAPDIIDVIVATLANPAVGLGVVGAKIKARANEVRAARGSSWVTAS
jgi:hypothetical protein